MKFGKSEIITIVVMVTIIGSLAVFFVAGSIKQNAADAPAAGALSNNESHTFATLDGEPIDLRQFDGQFRVVNSWASWNPFSAKELPDFSRLAAEFKEQDVVVLAINRKETKFTAEAFLNTIKDPLDGVMIILDPTDQFYKSVDGLSMPETIFYDREGNIVKHKRGFMNYQEMKSIVETMIKPE